VDGGFGGEGVADASGRFESHGEHSDRGEDVRDELEVDEELPFGDGEEEREAGHEPEEEEAAHLGRGEGGRGGHVVRESRNGREDRVEEDVDALAPWTPEERGQANRSSAGRSVNGGVDTLTSHSVHSVPYTGGQRPIKHRPGRAVNTKRRATVHREADLTPHQSRQSHVEHVGLGGIGTSRDMADCHSHGTPSPPGH
jgi:hypothetical protein